MKRSLMQIYVTESDKAITFYQEAFNAPVVASYPNDDGTFMHAELDIQGQILHYQNAILSTLLRERPSQAILCSFAWNMAKVMRIWLKKPMTY